MAHYGDIPVKSLQALAKAESSAFEADPAKIAEMIKASRLFDAEFYNLRNPDVAAAGADPNEHFARHGAAEGRNPNLWFDSAFYMADNPDIAAKITNPFLHYLYAGYAEGRRPNPELAKRGKRQILVLLATGATLNDIVQLLKHLPQMDASVISLPYPDLDMFGNARAFYELCQMNCQLRFFAQNEPGQSLLSILSDYRDDAIFMASPLAQGFAEGLDCLRQCWPKGEIAALNYGYGLFANGQLKIAREKSDKSGFAIPIPQAGMVVPPGAAAGILANGPLYLKYAPKYPAIWFAVQALIENKAFPETCASHAKQPSLDKLDEPDFKKELANTLICFRREIEQAKGLNILPEICKADLSAKFKWFMHEEMDWQNPKTYNQKLQYLKLYDDIPLKTLTSDKYRARQYIRKVAGKEYEVPLLGVWKNFDDIDFTQLPERFILKTTHGSGQNILVKNKAELDLEDARKKFAYWATTGQHELHEYNYFDIEPLIIAEPLLGENMADYKIYCFHGQPACLYVVTDRNTKSKLTFYTLDWQKMDIEHVYECASYAIPKPINFNLMLDLSRKLSQPFIFTRVDFFVLPDNSLKISEITFFPTTGFGSFKPASFDEQLGKMIRLESFQAKPV